MFYSVPIQTCQIFSGIKTGLTNFHYGFRFDKLSIIISYNIALVISSLLVHKCKFLKFVKPSKQILVIETLGVQVLF